MSEYALTDSGGAEMNNAPPPGVHSLNPTNVTSKGETDLTDVTKLRISRQEMNLALSRWALNVIGRVLIRGRPMGQAT